jgi:hypothetical protein
MKTVVSLLSTHFLIATKHIREMLSKVKVTQAIDAAKEAVQGTTSVCNVVRAVLRETERLYSAFVVKIPHIKDLSRTLRSQGVANPHDDTAGLLLGDLRRLLDEFTSSKRHIGKLLAESRRHLSKSTVLGAMAPISNAAEMEIANLSKRCVEIRDYVAHEFRYVEGHLEVCKTDIWYLIENIHAQIETNANHMEFDTIPDEAIVVCAKNFTGEISDYSGTPVAYPVSVLNAEHVHRVPTFYPVVFSAEPVEQIMLF